MNTPIRVRPQRRAVSDRVQEAVLPQGAFGQSIIAAVEGSQLAGQFLIRDTLHLTHVRVEPYGLECTGLQPAALLRERIACLLQAEPDAADRCECLEQQRVHVGFATSNTFAKIVPPLIGMISLSNPVADSNARHSPAVRQ